MPQKNIYAKELGIELASGREDEYFKWFLACLLFGKPIQQEVAKLAYLELVQEGITSPEAILKAGWDKLVEVLDRGYYVRYDFSTATKLLDVSSALKEKYGTFGALLQQSGTLDELSSRLQEFKGGAEDGGDFSARYGAGAKAKVVSYIKGLILLNRMEHLKSEARVIGDIEKKLMITHKRCEILSEAKNDNFTE